MHDEEPSGFRHTRECGIQANSAHNKPGFPRARVLTNRGGEHVLGMRIIFMLYGRAQAHKQFVAK